MLYYEEPYLKKITAKIVQKEKNRVLLNRTILYEGGGGQPPDHGTVRCHEKELEITHIGGLWHEINGDCNSESIEILLDWNFRYRMMKSHTAEHVFFRLLQNRGAELIKINLGEISSILFYGDIDIEDVLEAERKTKELIDESKSVRTFWIDKNEVPLYPKLRIKKDRIKGDRIRIVEIETHDISACRGIHVNNLSEIDDFAVLKFRDGNRKEVKFVVGKDARKFHHSASQTLRRIAWENKVEIEKMSAFVRNILIREKNMSYALKQVSEEIKFTKENCNGIEIFFRVFYGGERKIIVKRMMEYVTENTNRVIIYGDKEKQSIMCAFSPNLIWIKYLFLQLLNEHGEHGGGKGNFVSGSAKNIEHFMDYVKRNICNEAIRLHGDENEH